LQQKKLWAEKCGGQDKRFLLFFPCTVIVNAQNEELIGNIVTLL